MDPCTLRTSNIISAFEKKGRGEHIGKTAPDLHTVSSIIQHFGGTTGGGKNENKINLCNLTPTKSKFTDPN